MTSTQDTMEQQDENEDDYDEKTAHIFEHNRRFQAAVLATMERQMTDVDARLSLKCHELEVSQQVREDLALSFQQMKEELMKINKQQHKTASALRASEHECATLRNSNLHLLSELSSVTSSRDVLTSELIRRESTLKQVEGELLGAKQLSQVFSADIGMHRQLKENLSLEIRNLQHEIKKLQSSEQSLKSELDACHLELHGHKQDFNAQCMETKKAQLEVEKLVHELSLSRSAHQLLSKQWSSALSSLSARDSLVHSVLEKIGDEEKSNRIHQQVEHRLLEEQQHKDNELKNMLNIFNELQHKYDSLCTLHSSLTSNFNSLSVEHNQLLNSSNLATQQINELQRKNQQLNNQIATLTNKNTEYLNNYTHMKQQYESEKLKNSNILHSITSCEKTKAEQLLHDFEEEKQRRVTLEYEKQLEVNKCTELTEQIKEISKSSQMLHQELLSLTKKQESMNEHARSLNINLEHMTYRANKAESEMNYLKTTQQQERHSEQLALKGEIRNLELEVERKAKEVSEMNHAFVLAEEKVLEAHKTHTEIALKTEKLKNEIKNQENTKNKLHENIKFLEESNRSIILENNDERLRVRKHEQTIESLLNENEKLKLELSDVKFSSVRQRQELQDEMMVLKADIVKRKNARSDVVGVVEESERVAHLLERKYEYLLMKFERCQKEKNEIEKLYKDTLKSKREEKKEMTIAEKQFMIWMKNFENVLEKQSKKHSKMKPDDFKFSKSQTLSNDEILNNFYDAHPHLERPPVHLPSLDKHSPPVDGTPSSADSAPASSSTDGNAEFLHFSANGAKSAYFLEHLVMELRNTLHKTSTQSAERMNEIMKLKHEIKTLQQELVDCRSTSLLPRVHQLQSDYNLLQQCYSRCVCVAASLERQLLAEKKQHAKHDHDNVMEGYKDIDYSYYPSMQPSTRLKDALQDKSICMSSVLTPDDSTASLNTLFSSTAPLHAPTQSMHSSTSSLQLQDIQRFRRRKYQAINQHNTQSHSSIHTNQSVSSLGISPFASTSSLLPPSTTSNSTASLVPSRIHFIHAFDRNSQSSTSITSIQTERTHTSHQAAQSRAIGRSKSSRSVAQ